MKFQRAVTSFLLLPIILMAAAFLAASVTLRAGSEPATLIEHVMDIADRDKDGQLSLEEYKPLDVQARKHGQAHFEGGDANHGGLSDGYETQTGTDPLERDSACSPPGPTGLIVFRPGSASAL